MRKSFDITVTDKDGHTFTTWGECKNSTAETMKFINDWANECGHTVHTESYKEYSVPDNPGFVEACMSDIAGFNR